MFAGVPNNQVQITANVFTFFGFDRYSIFFVTTLYDYYQATKDYDTMLELWPLAFKQFEIAIKYLDNRYIISDLNSWYSFIDWQQELNKQASTQGVLINALRRAIEMANVLKDGSVAFLEQQLHSTIVAAKQYL